MKPSAVQTDAASNCKNVSAHGGATQECLRTHRALLTWNCQEQLFRQEVENADDLRLSTRLFKSCLEDKKKVRACCLYLAGCMAVAFACRLFSQMLQTALISLGACLMLFGFDIESA